MKTLEELDAIMNTPEYQQKRLKDVLAQNEAHLETQHEGETFYLVVNAGEFELLNARAERLDKQDYFSAFTAAKSKYLKQIKSVSDRK